MVLLFDDPTPKEEEQRRERERNQRLAIWYE